MVHGFSTSREREPGAGTYGSGNSFIDALEAALRRHAAGPLAPRQLRDDLRPLVRRALDMDAPVEQLLVTIKSTWAGLPEVRSATAQRVEHARRLDRVVTVLIELYFER